MRKYKGLSLEEMAELLNISVEQLWQYKHDMAEIYPDMLLSMSMVLEVEINEFFRYVDLRFA